MCGATISGAIGGYSGDEGVKVVFCGCFCREAAKGAC